MNSRLFICLFAVVVLAACSQPQVVNEPSAVQPVAQKPQRQIDARKTGQFVIDAYDIRMVKSFFEAVAVGDIEAVSIYLDKGVRPDVMIAKDPRTALGVAIDKGQTETALLLLRRGADPNHPYEKEYRIDKNSRLPMAKALVAKNLIVFKALIDAMDQGKAKNPTRELLVSRQLKNMAVAAGIDFVTALLDAGVAFDNESLRHAMFQKSREVFELLLVSGVKPGIYEYIYADSSRQPEMAARIASVLGITRPPSEYVQEDKENAEKVIKAFRDSDAAAISELLGSGKYIWYGNISNNILGLSDENFLSVIKVLAKHPQYLEYSIGNVMINAINRDNIEALEFLASLGYRAGRTLFQMKSIENGEMRALDIVKTMYPNPNQVMAPEWEDQPSSLFWGPIHYHYKNPKTLMFLVDYGVDVNQRLSNGQTPLIGVAYSIENFEAFALMIMKGADVHAVNAEGHNALHAVARMTGRNSSKPHKEVDFAKLLIDRKIDVNQQDVYGNTPLMYSKSVPMSKLLIENGARTDIENLKGETVFVVMKDLSEVIKAISPAGVGK